MSAGGVGLKNPLARRKAAKVQRVSATGATPGADLGGSSNYSTEKNRWPSRERFQENFVRS